MVRVKISGGLGNQMFQYIYGQYLKILLNKKIFYVAKMSSNSSSFTKRSLDLENFDVPNFQYSESRISFWERVFRKFILIFPMLNRKYIIQQNPHDIPDIERSVNYYDGYWQNYIYYNVVKEKIGNPFTLSQEDLFKYESIINEIKNCQAVSIHVRRNDYINIPENAKIFEVCENEYYEKTISYIKERIENPVFFIFSQDQEWCTENFKGYNFIFMDKNPAHIDVFLMSICKHNIIANSTFSWWGAILNENVEKMVFYPKRWYKDKRSLTKFIPNVWLGF